MAGEVQSAELVIEAGRYGFVDAPHRVSTGGVGAGIVIAFLNRSTRMAGVLHAPNLDATRRPMDDFLTLAFLAVRSGDIAEAWLGGGDALALDGSSTILADRARAERRLRAQIPDETLRIDWIDEPDTLAEVLVTTDPPGIHPKLWKLGA